METPEALQQCVRRAPQMSARLRRAMTRLADAERARIWALAAAQEAGVSIRQSARATGVSPTRIPQLLQVDEVRAIPVRLSQLQDQRPASEEATACVPYDRPRVLRVLARMVADLEALARCALARTEALPAGQKERRAASSAARRAGASAATTEPVGRAGRLTTSTGTLAV
jgi:hypothetical protein